MDAHIINNTLWAEGKGFIELRAPGFSNTYRPGQLCMLSVSSGESTDPILRRPFAPYSANGDMVGILYAVVGKGTASLAQKRAGDVLNLSLPHGKPFTVLRNKKVALIGGGVGIAPINAMANLLLSTGCDVTVYYGGRTVADLYPPLVANAPYKLITATEDGSHGHKGFVTDALRQTMDTYDMCYTCGPTPMMKAVDAVCKEANRPLEASLEEVMACGIGVCNGCMVDVKEGDKIVRKRCCTEGPVFRWNNIE